MGRVAVEVESDEDVVVVEGVGELLPWAPRCWGRGRLRVDGTLLISIQVCTANVATYNYNYLLIIRLTQELSVVEGAKSVSRIPSGWVGVGGWYTGGRKGKRKKGGGACEIRNIVRCLHLPTPLVRVYKHSHSILHSKQHNRILT